MAARSTRRKIIIAKPSEDELQQMQHKQQQQTAMLIRQISTHGGEQRAVPMGGTAIERSMVSPGSIAIYSVKPAIATETQQQQQQQRVAGKTFTLFAVHVQNAISGRSWVVHRRYSDFLLLQQLIAAHFKLFIDEFPRLEELVRELYFPRKHKLRSKMANVIEHRCDAFLEYLVAVHRVLISQSYLQRKEISDVGLSIFRGFLGSSLVLDSVHRDYTFHKPIRPSAMQPSNRTPVNQCGALLTVVEEDAEAECEVVNATAADATTPGSSSKYATTDESTDETDDFDGSSSCGESTDTEETDERESVFRRHAKKYARSRHSLEFLKKKDLRVDT